jgi:uncharacterized protein (TIGR00369 family)
MTTGVELARCQAACAEFNASPYYATLGMHAESSAPGSSRITLAYSERLLQMYGGIHGGALLSVADAALMVACFTALDEGFGLGTIEISMHFLAPAGAHHVIAEGKVTRRGKTLAFSECVLQSNGRDIARAQGIAAIRPRDVVTRGQSG